MKNFTVIPFLLIILLMLVYQCSKAQDTLTTASGDIINGRIKILSYGPEKKVQISNEGKKKQVYSIFQIRTFIKANERFLPVKTREGYDFMKVIREGYLSLLAFQPKNQANYDGLYLLKKDGTGTEVPNLTFKKIMSRFLADCENVTRQIEAGTLGKKDLNAIVASYNQCVADRTTLQGNAATVAQETESKKSVWQKLEEKVNAQDSFEGKSDALEMIADIKGKVDRGEKIPNFLIEGLKQSLAPAGLQPQVEEALKATEI